MNAIFLSSPNKSLRQISNSRYNHGVENLAQAPQRRLFHFPSHLLAFTRSAKPSTFNNLHTLKFGRSATHSFSSTSALFEKHRGCTPKLPILEPPPCSRVRFPERGPFQLILAPLPPPTSKRRQRSPIPIRDQSPHGRRSSIFTCNKKAICPTLNGNAPASNHVE
jgi:hypothetical protein